jgi:hypothetical protein
MVSTVICNIITTVFHIPQLGNAMSPVRDADVSAGDALLKRRSSISNVKRPHLRISGYVKLLYIIVENKEKNFN